MHGKRSPTLAPMRAGSEVTSEYQIFSMHARKKRPHGSNYLYDSSPKYSFFVDLAAESARITDSCSAGAKLNLKNYMIW